MRALTVTPGAPGSVQLRDVPAPGPTDDLLLAETLRVGVCGTDAEIVAGDYGSPPAGRDDLVIGHETVARVLRPASTSDLVAGDLIVPLVRRPDPVPCGACAAGEWDMCENGRYTEHGITGADGFARDRFLVEPGRAVAVPAALGLRAVLTEPASVVAKAWEQIERIGRRAHWRPRTVLVTGAGPIGLLAALLARQRGFATHVLDRITTGPKPGLVADIGATYHTGSVADVADAGDRPDIVIECTGVGHLVLDAIDHTGRNGIVCLTGLSSGARHVDIDPTDLNRRLVLENDVVFGTVNANRRHYLAAVDALTAAPPDWLDRIITRSVPLERWPEALTKTGDDIKVTLDLRG